MSSRVEKKNSARERAAAVREQQRRAERRRRLLLASAAVLTVVVVIGGLVVARIAGVGTSSAGPSGEASATLLKTIQTVPAGTFDAVGTGGVTTGPNSADAPVLTRDGKPRVLYIGAEYCPYCAAERWPMTVALSRFGRFTTLGTTHSATADVFPDTATLSFHKSAYSSDYLDFTGVETTTNKPTATGYQALDKPTPADEKILDTFDKSPYVTSQAGSIPFIDIGGTWLSAGSTYDPGLLKGKTHAQIAHALSDPDDPIAKAVLGSANLFTAAICKVTDDQPGDVCTTAGVTQAATQLGG